MTARKTKKQVVQRVLQILQSKPMTVNELAIAANSNWDTVNNALELLIAINLVELTEKEGKKIYCSKQDDSLMLRKDTLFGIPLTEKQENICKMLFMKLRTKWIEKKKYPPNKTQIQKMTMAIAEDMKLTNIPKGWYLFGDCCVLEYDIEKNYTYDEVSIKGLNQKLNEVIDEYSVHGNTYQLKKYHYEKYHNTLYLIKLKIQEILTDYKLDFDSLKILSELLYSLVYEFPNTEDNHEIFEVINTYVAIVNQMITTLSEKEFTEKRYLLNDTFSAIWELMATYHFFNDLSKGNYGYNRDSLKKYFSERLTTLQTISKDYLSELELFITKDPINTKKSSILAFKGIIHNVKRLSEKDRKILLEEFSKNKSDIFREFNL